MTTQYDYNIKHKIDDALNINKAIEYTIINYMHHQLGWTLDDCKKRVITESNREIPKGVLNYLEGTGWKIKGAKLIDIGSGQGGMVLEALIRGAEAYGIEPGEEFTKLARMRLRDAGFNQANILSTSGEAVPFDSDIFDYVISLQVLEHVKNPEKILNEIFRILKPGGRCHISCENYLSFREQHYRVAWLPLLPKFIGGAYLKIIGRDPSFLKNYVYYTTYPEIWRVAKKAGFINLTYKCSIDKILNTDSTSSNVKTFTLRIIKRLPKKTAEKIILYWYHFRNFYKVGVSVLLVKPNN